jgi:hypothetical protein
MPPVAIVEEWKQDLHAADDSLSPNEEANPGTFVQWPEHPGQDDTPPIRVVEIYATDGDGAATLRERITLGAPTHRVQGP